MNHISRGYILECCVDSVESALAAAAGGANRLELCSNLIIGGTSPSLALFHQVRQQVDIPVNVLLRPRFGDFLYTPYELDILKEEVAMFREAGADGVVIGCLTADGELDRAAMEKLLELRGSMNVTLHRAFDVSRDPYRTLQECIDMNIQTILTSGQKNSCMEGCDLIASLHEKAEGRIDIMAGAGVNASVIREMLPKVPLRSFHMSGKKTLDSGMLYRKQGVSMGLSSLSEFEIWRTDSSKIKEAQEVLLSFWGEK